MTESNAKLLASLIGGTAIHTGGGLWLVRIEKWNGHVVLVSDEGASEYEDDDAADAGREMAGVGFTR